MTNILIIDDSQTDLWVLSDLLKALIPDIQVSSSLSSIEGLEKAKTRLPDTILLDVNMPGMDGLEVCKQLKSSLKTKQIPIILLLETHTDSISKIKGMDLGVEAFLSKPVDPRELVAQVKVMLRLKKAEDQLGNEKKQLEIQVEEKLKALKKAETILQDEGLQKQLAAALEQVTESIMMVDNKGTIQYINPVTEQMFGYSEKEIIGQNLRFLKNGKNTYKFYQQMWQTITRGEVWRGFVINKKKNGALCEVDMTISPIRNEKGEIKNFIAVKRDVTRERELEKQLRQTQKMEAIGTLAGGIAHDFNNILFAITGYATLAKRHLSENVEYQQDLKQVLRAGERAKELVQQILTFSRQNEQEVVSLQIIPLIKETLKFLRASLPTTIKISQNVPPSCGDILADHTQIHQILMNLCTNAGYAMREQGGELKVTLKETIIKDDLAILHSIKTGVYLQLTITDTGNGILPEVQEHIFEPFYTTKPEHEGTGMGLAVVHGIIKSYGGAITFNSQINQGTAFEILLPVVNHKALHQTADTADIANPSLTGQEHILVIDDESVLADLLKEMLEMLDYKVTIASDAQQAIDFFLSDKFHFDLVITDLNMPGMSGDQLAKELLRIRPDLPIILATGFSYKIGKEEIQKIGIRNLLMKPFDLNLLGTMVRETLD